MMLLKAIVFVYVAVLAGMTCFEARWGSREVESRMRQKRRSFSRGRKGLRNLEGGNK
jgi:hypothetical protein